MASQVYSYSPKNVITTLNGQSLIGWESITLKYDKPHWEFTPHTQGDITRNRNENLMATLTIEVKQTSEANKVLFDVLNACDVKQVQKYVLPEIPGFLTFEVKDTWGLDVFTLRSATIEESAEITYKESAENGSYVFKGLLEFEDYNKLGTNKVNADGSGHPAPAGC